MEPPNVYTATCEYDDADPEGFRAGIARVGAAAGGNALSVRVFELPPGQSVSPYHYEYEEEWVIVLSGDVVVRVPDGELQLGEGGVACFPPGPPGAHRVANRSDASARVVMFSSAREPAVAVYPDSDKIGVWPGNPDDVVMLRRADGHRDYYDGERPGSA